MEIDAPKGLALLADPTRQALVATLAAEPLPVCDLVRLLYASQPVVSRHLRLLHEAGMVEVLDSPFDRRLRIYRLQREPFAEDRRLAHPGPRRLAPPTSPCLHELHPVCP